MFKVAGVLSLALSAAANFNTERLELVKQINQNTDLWTAGVDHRFGKEPIGASKPLLGVKEGNLENMRKAISRGEIEMSHYVADDIPDNFDAGTAPQFASCSKVITEIRDQSNCGCCWAFGAASAASDRLCIATNGTVALSLSAQDLCFCGSGNGCGGGFLQVAWAFVKSGVVSGGQQGKGPFDQMGLCKDFDLPYCHHHGPQGDDPFPAEGQPGCESQSSPKCDRTCDGNATAPHNDYKNDGYSFAGQIAAYPNVEAIQTAIMTNGPVEAAFSVYSDFENYVSGIYHRTPGTSMLGGHAIRIVGWGVENDVKYWKVANSWNPYWGENGYFRIVRGVDECGIEAQAMSSSGSAVWAGTGVPSTK